MMGNNIMPSFRCLKRQAGSRYGQLSSPGAVVQCYIMNHSS